MVATTMCFSVRVKIVICKAGIGSIWWRNWPLASSNIAFRIARGVVKFLDLVLQALPQMVLAEKVADDGMKITLLVPSCCCGPKTDTMPLNRLSGNLMPVV